MNYRSRECLHELYVKKKMSVEEISGLAGVGPSTIYKYLRKNNIKRRSISESNKLAYKNGRRKSGKDHHFYKRVKTKEHIESIIKSISKEGNVRINSYGYVDIKKRKHPSSDKNGYIRLHRLVIEKHLGRYLYPEEVVHHINGNKKDNRIENLHLFKSSIDHSYFHGLEKSGVSIPLKYHYNVKRSKKCVICGKYFTCKPSAFKLRKTCSRECGYKSQSITNKQALMRC